MSDDPFDNGAQWYAHSRSLFNISSNLSASFLHTYNTYNLLLPLVIHRYQCRAIQIKCVFSILLLDNINCIIYTLLKQTTLHVLVLCTQDGEKDVFSHETRLFPSLKNSTDKYRIFDSQ